LSIQAGLGTASNLTAVLSRYVYYLYVYNYKSSLGQRYTRTPLWVSNYYLIPCVYVIKCLHCKYAYVMDHVAWIPTVHELRITKILSKRSLSLSLSLSLSSSLFPPSLLIFHPYKYYICVYINIKQISICVCTQQLSKCLYYLPSMYWFPRLVTYDFWNVCGTNKLLNKNII